MLVKFYRHRAVVVARVELNGTWASTRPLC